MTYNCQALMRKMVGKFTIQADLNLTKKKLYEKSNFRQFKFKKKKLEQ